MPSDANLARALAAVAAQREAFRTAVAAAATEIAGRLHAAWASGNGWAAGAGLELGTFAAGRIDAELFAAIFGRDAPLDPLAVARLDLARQTMLNLLDAGDTPFTVRLEPRDELYDHVRAALARCGRAFAAARVAETVRLRRQALVDSEALPDRFPPASWNRVERQVAPPLVVELDGGDLVAGGLAEFLTGAQKIVILARGVAPPAPLVRLITPGVYVQQTSDASELDRIGPVAGPAIAALLPEGCARFVHRPGSESLRNRLRVESLPPQPRSSVGKISLFQQTEELEQLRLLAEFATEPALPLAVPGTPAITTPDPEPDPEPDPADRLAAWLLAQAGLNGAGEGQV